MDASSAGDDFGGIERVESGEWRGQGPNPLKKDQVRKAICSCPIVDNGIPLIEATLLITKLVDRCSLMNLWCC